VNYIMLSFALLVMLNFDRSTVKHALQNMQNDVTSGLLTVLECTKFVFGRGPGGAAAPFRLINARGHQRLATQNYSTLLPGSCTGGGGGTLVQKKLRVQNVFIQK